MSKTSSGNFFEDFRLGQTIKHATPRTVTAGDVALYTALYGTRFAVQSSDAFAHAIGYPRRAGRRPAGVPHGVRQDRAGHLAQRGRQSRLRGLPVPGPVYPGDTLSARRRRSSGSRRTPTARPASSTCAPPASAGRRARPGIRALGDGAKARRGGARARRPRAAAAGGARAAACWAMPARRSTPAPTISPSPAARTAGATTRSGEKIDHVDGMTVEEAEHQIATRLYQNTRACISTSSPRAQGRFGRRLVYGGHVISLARALSFNGLANAFHIAGDQWRPARGAAVRRRDRVRLVARCWPRPSCPAAATSARCACARSPPRTGRAPSSRSRAATTTIRAVILDLDYWVLDAAVRRCSAFRKRPRPRCVDVAVRRRSLFRHQVRRGIGGRQLMPPTSTR